MLGGILISLEMAVYGVLLLFVFSWVVGKNVFLAACEISCLLRSGEKPDALKALDEGEK